LLALGRWLSYHPILISQLVLDESLCAAPGIAPAIASKKKRNPAMTRISSHSPPNRFRFCDSTPA